MKTVWWCLAVIGGLVLAGAVSAHFLIDEEARKNAIATELEEHLDARVSIAGEVSFSFLPQPRLQLSDVRITPRNGSHKALPRIEISRVGLDISLAALISGDSGLQKASLIQPRLTLASPSRKRTGQAMARTHTWLERIEGLAPLQLEVSDGEIRLEGSVDEPRILADRISMTTGVPESGTPLRFDGEAHWREDMHRISLAIGGAGADRQRAFDFSWSSTGRGAAQARLRGDMTLAEEQPRLAGQLNLEGEDLEAFLVGKDGDDRPELPFELEGDIESDLSELTLSEADVRLADADATSQANILFSQIPAVDLRIDIPRLDLVAWKQRLQGRSGELLSAVLESNIDGRLRIRLDSLGIKDDLVQDVLMDATLAPGAALIERLQATAPGGTRLQLSGTLAPEGRNIGFDGNLRGDTGNLRGFLDWLDLDTSSMPGDRLRHAELSSGFHYADDLLQLTDLRLGLDVSTFSGGIAVALRDRLGLGLGLKVDRLELDDYLSRTEASQSEDLDRALLAKELSSLGKLLTRFDANLDLQAGRLTYLGQQLTDLQLAGRLQGGKLTFERLGIGNLDGLEATLSGQISQLDSIPQLQDTQFDLTLGNPGRLASSMNLPFKSYIQRLEPIHASGILDGSMNSLSLNSNLEVADASLFLAGSITHGEDGTGLTNGKLDLDGLSGSQIGDWFELSEDNSLRLLPDLNATSNFSLSQGTWDYETRFQSAGAQLDLQGTTEDLDIGYPVSNFRFDFLHPQDSDLLSSLLDHDGAQLPELQASGQAKASPRAVEVPKGALSLGNDTLEVTGDWIFSRQRPEMNLDVRGPRLSLDNLEPLLLSRSNENLAFESPLPLSFMTTHQGRLDLQLDRLETPWEPLENLAASMELENNRLQVEKANGRVLGGQFRANGALVADAIGSYQASLDGALTDMPFHYFADALLGGLSPEGTFDVPVKLSTEGDTLSRMLRNLSGEMGLSGQLLQGPQQNAGILADPAAREVDRIFGLLDLPAAANGKIRVESGRLTSDNLEFQGTQRRLTLDGILADLPRRRIAATAELFEKDGNNPASALEITGSLGAPEYRWEIFGQSLSNHTTPNETRPAWQ